jgi:hypothetical protein
LGWIRKEDCEEKLRKRIMISKEEMIRKRAPLFLHFQPHSNPSSISLNFYRSIIYKVERPRLPSLTKP